MERRKGTRADMRRRAASTRIPWARAAVSVRSESEWYVIYNGTGLNTLGSKEGGGGGGETAERRRTRVGTSENIAGRARGNPVLAVAVESRRPVSKYRAHVESPVVLNATENRSHRSHPIRHLAGYRATQTAGRSAGLSGPTSSIVFWC